MTEPTRRQSCLVVAHNYHPAVGAAAIRLQLLTSRLVDDQMAVTVLTSSTDQELTGPSGETVIGTSRGWMPSSRVFRTLVLAARGAAAARRHDVVISDPPPYVALAAMLGARAAGATGVFYYCDSWASVAASRPSRAWHAAGKVFGLLEAAAALTARVTAASTPALAQRARSWSSRVELVRNGTDLSTYHPQGPAWEGQELPKDYFLYAGTMGLVHGAEVFVNAAEQLWAEGKDVGLVFVGSGAESEVIREAAQRSQGRILFLDPLPPEQIARLYRGCAGALSSMRPVPGYEDARPVKTLAAMACGAIPVYVSGGELAGELADAGLGFVAPYSVAGARQTMEAVLRLSDAERERLSAECRRHAEEHFDQRLAASQVARAIAEPPARHARRAGLGRR
ncbi:glycosyltransferase [Luteococcus sp. H138]|uniref:glycosyltransferase n=1 Tax=unclassified Luteococcus TaxID=2639923 RepID=UPI00313D7D01